LSPNNHSETATDSNLFNTDNNFSVSHPKAKQNIYLTISSTTTPNAFSFTTVKGYVLGLVERGAAGEAFTANQ
jgi:hypothetical protein